MSLEDYIDPLFWKSCLISIAISILGGFGYHTYKSIETGEWNLKKRNAIFYEFDKVSSELVTNKKEYFDWASKALDIDKNKKHYLHIAEIRGELKKSLNSSLSIGDFKKYIEINKKE